MLRAGQVRVQMECDAFPFAQVGEEEGAGLRAACGQGGGAGDRPGRGAGACRAHPQKRRPFGAGLFHGVFCLDRGCFNHMYIHMYIYIYTQTCCLRTTTTLAELLFYAHIYIYI